MGNQQGGGGGGPGRRDRLDSSSGAHPSSQRHHRVLTGEDECPVQVKIAKTGQPSPTSSVPSMQYENTTEFPVVIKWTGPQNKAVSISGSWDTWKKKIPLVKSHDDFTTIVNLPEGKHEYKFLVDGNWNCDNNLPKTDNKMGGQNNVVLIDRQDFEVFDALDKDLQSTMVSASGPGGANPLPDKELDRTKPYGQEIPDRRDFEKAHNPPVLPPHLLQVILNKDTPVSCDPNVLPEPNHVMLNHLYALSIKDGVMVLSATHRYRKKYVTTLLYRPI